MIFNLFPNYPFSIFNFQLRFFFVLHPLQAHQLIAFLDAHDDDALDIALVDVDGSSGDADDDAAVFDEHHVVIFAHHHAAGNARAQTLSVILLMFLSLSHTGSKSLAKKSGPEPTLQIP